jgi:hypothetical protein
MFTLNHVRQSYNLLDVTIFNRLVSLFFIFLKLVKQDSLFFLHFPLQFGLFQRSSSLEAHDKMLKVDFGLGVVIAKTGTHCNRNEIKCNVLNF